jgi:2-C-methyl-D-erythritol 4-phosphate cytidylyltransferase
MSKYVIIVAGGMGQRMQADLPKQLLQVAGKEIIIHTIEKFLAYDASIHVTVVIHESLEATFNGLLKKYKLESRVHTVKGGDTRFQSVKNGLDTIRGNGVVGIHDAARPLVSTETIARCYDAAAQAGNAVPVVPVNESLRETDGEWSKAADRNRYKTVQTPQCFDTGLIKKAFEQDYSLAFTDDATVLESTGEAIHLVEGNTENIKITYPLDLKIAELLLNK